MSDTDWEKRYQNGDMPWEKGEASPGLVDFLNENPDLPRGRVLVPGCGTGHDARAWAAAGFEVTGYDIAPSAIQLAEQKTAEAGLNVRFVLGDFLSDNPTQRYDWIFEHTLFCAIDPKRRDDYVKAVLRWLTLDGYYMAVNYFIPDEDGPPFGTNRDEQLRRFGTQFHLLEDWVPRSYPNRMGLERMFLWQRK